jgi:hypothetical protein
MIEAPSPPAEFTPPQPPLGISHLMLWILGAAVVLGNYRAYSDQNEAAPILQAVFVGNQLVFSLLAGINIAAVIVYARRLVVRDAPLLAEPGHWLLAIAGVSNLAAWLVIAVGAAAQVVLQPNHPPNLTPAYHWLGYGIGSFLSFAMCQVAVVAIREPLRWRIYFLMSGLFSAGVGLALVFMYLYALDESRAGSGIFGAVRWYSSLYSLDQIVGILLLSFNLIADRVDRTPREWERWRRFYNRALPCCFCG